MMRVVRVVGMVRLVRVVRMMRVVRVVVVAAPFAALASSMSVVVSTGDRPIVAKGILEVAVAIQVAILSRDRRALRQ